MHNKSYKTLLLPVFSLVMLLGAMFTASSALATLERQPYLQSVSDTRVVVRWRTTAATSSRVSYGPSLGNLNTHVDIASSSREHEVVITGLTPNTKYFYSAGGTNGVIEAGNDVNHYFTTAPVVGSNQKLRIWAIGDPGTGTTNQRNVRNAYYNLDNVETNVVLTLGDNAYNDGTDSEYTNNFFNVYSDLFRHAPVWATRGNHERNLSVHETAFTHPTQAEAGGVASGSELYYSFDYGNIHFVCLDSFTSSNLNGTAMYTWLENDLASTTQKWIIAFWHHPPYSRSSNHDSNSEVGQRVTRERANPILEKYGVDLQLGGHNHFYSRTVLINNHYGLSGSYNAATHAIDAGNGRADGDGDYQKGSNPEGAVYVLAGSSGKIGYTPIHHPANYTEVLRLGSMVIDVDGDRMDIRMLRENGAIQDWFSITKAPAINQAPFVNAGGDQAIQLPAAATLSATASDDGLPTGSALSTTWTTVSGPGIVTFTNASATSTTANFAAAGTYVLRITASDTELSSSDDVIVTVASPPGNQAPVVSAGANQSITLPISATLNGSVTDDGLPTGAAVTPNWSQVSGPGVVTFANAASARTTASFSAAGTYVLQLSASDSALSSSATVTVTVNPAPVNQAPLVSAGTNQTITLPSSATLNGSVTDDGLPTGAVVTSSWSQVSGPGVVTFSNAASARTTASFSAAGSYVLRLTARDTQLSTSADVTVIVNPEPPNTPPRVTAGADQNAVVGVALTLNGTVTDDGRPNPPGAVSVTWSQVSGPGSARFSDTNSARTAVTLPIEGSYVLRLTASDGAASSSDDITLIASVAPVALEAENFETGQGNWVNVSVGDVEDWTRDSGGTRSSGTGPARGNNGSTWYTYLETSDGSGAFTAGDTAILEGPRIASGSNRSLSFFYHMYGSNIGTLNVDVESGGVWTEGVWTLSGQQHNSNAAAFTQATVDLGSFSGPIKVRFRAVAAGGFRGDMAIDDIEITGIQGPPVNQAPIVNAGADQTVVLPDPATLIGSVIDEGLPSGATVTASWSLVSGPGTVSFGNASAASTTASFSVAGTYLLRLTGNDTVLSASDDIEVTVLEPGSTPVVLEAEGFETGLGNWANVLLGDAEDWTRDSGGTPSSGTGPATGNNGSTWYTYLETSSRRGAFTAGDTAILEGPAVGGNARVLTFHYHMYGANIGTLNVDVESGGIWTQGVWTLSGQQHSSNTAAYTPATVDLGSFAGAIRVRFRAVAAGGYRGDMAIDDIEITGIQGSHVNQAPMVSAGPDQSVALPNSATLSGTVTDDGLPVGTTTASWSRVSGPGVVTFTNAASASTTASFSATGTYVLRLTGSDGQLSSFDDVTVTVSNLPGTEIVLEENASGGDKQEVKKGQKGAQSFRHAGANYSVTKVTLYLSKTSGSAEPNGPLLFSIGTRVNGGTIAGSEVSIRPSQVTNMSEGISFAAVDVVFASPVRLRGGTTYYMNLADGSSNGGIYFLDYTSRSTYANGSYFKSGVVEPKDIRFTIIGSE